MDIINNNNLFQNILRQLLAIKLNIQAHNLGILSNNSKMDNNISILIQGLVANNMECKPKVQVDLVMGHS
jgi:hypothetical protein